MLRVEGFIQLSFFFVPCARTIVLRCLPEGRHNIYFYLWAHWCVGYYVIVLLSCFVQQADLVGSARYGNIHAAVYC